MGTPEFPNLGKHCSIEDCKQIDFLPFTCDCCHKVFCLDHRSYTKHQCPNANKNDVTVVICPLCAIGVRLIPEEDPNITWESHVNTECDPSNYEKATKKRKCPVRGCREVLTFSNTVKCRDCTIDHCLKHRFGLDHTCPGPKKPNQGFHILGFLNRSPSVEPRWSSSWLSAATSFLSGEFGQKLKTGESSGVGGNNQVEQCPLCRAKFLSGRALVDHVQNVHKEKGLMKATIDVCPKCSRGFRDPLDLVKHVEREHGGTSRALG